MTFMQNLANNPSGSGGIYGMPKQVSDDDVLSLVRQLKDREMQDFKDKANFMSNLSIKQDRIRSILNPDVQREKQLEQQLGQNGSQDISKMNTVMARDPNEMTGYQKAQVEQDKQNFGLNREKLAQTNRLGEERLGIQDAAQKLNQQKSDQIKAQKEAELEQKTNDTAQKFSLLQAELDRKTKAGEDTLQLRRDIADSAEERHKLEMEKAKHDMDLKDEQFNELKKKNEEILKQGSNTETTTELNADGTKKTVTTKKGSAAKRVPVKDSQGNIIGTIPEDKLDDWNQNYAGKY